MAEAADTAGLDLAVAREIGRSFAEAERRGHGDEDMAAVYRAIASRTAADSGGGRGR